MQVCAVVWRDTGLGVKISISILSLIGISTKSYSRQADNHKHCALNFFSGPKFKLSWHKPAKLLVSLSLSACHPPVRFVFDP